MDEADLPVDEEGLIICVECLAEPVSDCQIESELEQEGWDFSGEFGPRCPECFGKNVAPTQTEGIDAVAASAGIKKE